MKKKKIGVMDLRFMVKALRWASQDRDTLAEAWGYSGQEGKLAARDSVRCLLLKEAINQHLTAGGKGLSCAMDDIIDNADLIDISDIRKGLESGEFIINDSGMLTRVEKDKK